MTNVAKKGKSLIQNITAVVKNEVSEVVENVQQKVVAEVKQTLNTALIGRTLYDTTDVLRDKILFKFAEISTKYRLNSEIVKQLQTAIEQEFNTGRDLIFDQLVRVLQKEQK